MPTEAINAMIQACVIGLALGVGVMSLVRLRMGVFKGLLWPAAFVVGAIGGYLRVMVGEWPHVPPREATEAFILFIVPTAVLIDALDGTLQLRRGVRWALWGIASLAVPVMLFFNRIGDLLEGAASWTPAEATMHMGCMVVALAGAAFVLGAAFRASGVSPVVAEGADDVRESAKPAFDVARHLPLALVPVAGLAGLTLLSSGSYRLGALTLAAVASPLAGAYLALATGCPPIGRKIGPMIFILPLGAMIIMGYELAGLTLANAALLSVAAVAPALVALPRIRSVLREPWQAITAMVLLGLLPAAGAAIPAMLAAMRASQNDYGY